MLTVVAPTLLVLTSVTHLWANGALARLFPKVADRRKAARRVLVASYAAALVLGIVLMVANGVMVFDGGLHFHF